MEQAMIGDESINQTLQYNILYLIIGSYRGEDCFVKFIWYITFLDYYCKGKKGG